MHPEHSGARLRKIPILLSSLFPGILRMAGAAQRAAPAAAAAGGFPFFLISYHIHEHSRHRDHQNPADDDCGNILPNPCKHQNPPILKFPLFPNFHHAGAAGIKHLVKNAVPAFFLLRKQLVSSRCPWAVENLREAASAASD